MERNLARLSYDCFQVQFPPADLYFMHLPRDLRAGGLYKVSMDYGLVEGGVSILNLFEQTQALAQDQFLYDL